MLVQIAWRNIWRNKARSLVVIAAVIIGLWAGIFILAFAWGLYKSNIDETVGHQLSHLQVHHPLFGDQQEAQFFIADSDTLLSFFEQDVRVQSASSRVIAKGMVASPTAATGVTIYGISPAAEKRQIALDGNLIAGSYFDSDTINGILIGEKLAKRLKIKLRSKVVLTFTDTHANMVSTAFRVTGIYRSKNLSLDEVNVYVPKSNLGGLLGLEQGQSHELAILLFDDRELDTFKKEVAQWLPSTKVEDWKDLAPELELVIESFHLYTYIITGIILLALTFGIVNTMLMSVLERIRELGMLMAIGLNKRKIFLMIMLETLFLTLIGGPIGLMVGWSSVTVLGTIGINMSLFSEGLASYGFSTMIYPALENDNYGTVALMTFVTAMLSALYPAYKALQLNPAESIRKI